MKTVSYKEYQKEVNNKKKSTNTPKKKNTQNFVKNSVNIKTDSTNNKKKTNTSQKKNTQNIVKNKNIKTSVDIKKEKTNISNKKNNSTSTRKNTQNTIKEKNIKDLVNIKTDNTLIKNEELKDIFLDNDIKILNDKDLNKMIKSYEKDIKKEIPKKRKKRRRIRWNNVTLLIFILFFLSLLIISSVKIIDWLKDSKSSGKEISEIQENTEVIETETNEETEIIQTPEEEIPKTSPYWTYIEMDLIDVDFTELKEKNNDTAGWIQVNGTNINYPFVQTSNNEYYLTHSFDKAKNKAGWVFMDYRNNQSDFDKNTIIYAHSRKNNTMFGTLRKILKNGWLNNTKNHVIKLSTETENTLWQVFSVYRIPTTNDYIQVNFVNDVEFVNFGKMLIERSSYNFKTSISSEDKILTLSTCYDDNDKVVLHAKLIKREKK